MAVEAQRIGEVEGLGEIYQAIAPLDEQIESFKEAGISPPYLADVEEVAKIRLAGVSNDYSRTRIIPIALKGELTVLTRTPLLMNPLMAKLAVNANGSGKQVEMPSEIYEIARDSARSQENLEPEDREAIVLSQMGRLLITPEMDEAGFLFRSSTKDYFGKFAHSSIPLWDLPANSKKLAIVNYLWFNDPQDGSGLSIRDRDLCDRRRAFGVLGKTAEGCSQKLGYISLTDIKNANSQAVAEALQEKNMSGLTEILKEPLTENLLKKLRSR